MSKQKYYVVWRGRIPGVYLSWEECEEQVKQFPSSAFKAFATEAEARQAFEAGPPQRPARPAGTSPSASQTVTAAMPSDAGQNLQAASPSLLGLESNAPGGHASEPSDLLLNLPPEVRLDALAVDAACSGNPGPMEYRGVSLATGRVVFHYGPLYGTNNIGEFLAIVHALALLTAQGSRMAVYSDSRNALLWVRARRCRTTLQRTERTEPLFRLIERAERWLNTHDFSAIPLLKWETSRWGEVPADFGRK